MRKLLTTLFLTAFIVSFSGCIEEKNEYFVNSDGSGKVIHEILAAGGNDINFSGDDSETDPDTQLKQLAQEIMQNAKGVETWSDVATEISDDGRLHFKGTAYFGDITQVSFEHEDINMDAGVIFTRDGQLLTLALEDDDTDNETASEAANLTDAQLQELIKQQRLKYNQSRPMMAGILGNLSLTTIVHYQGTVRQSVNFQTLPSPAKGISLAFEGRTFLEYVDSVMTDDEKIAQMIRSGKTLDDSDFEGYYEYLGGQPQKPKAVINLTGNLFDYDRDVEKAKAGYDAIIQTLDLPASASIETKTAAYTPGMSLQDLRVGGARVIYFEDKTIDYRPFNQFVGYELSLLGKLPAANMQIDEGVLTKAETLSGVSLLPKEEFDRSLNWLKLANDGYSVSFNIKMKVPAETAKGLSEIAGELKCFKSNAIKTIDLGVMELKKGEANNAEGISITEAGKSDWADVYEIELKMHILKHALKDIKLFTEDGTQIETDFCGGMSSNGFWLQRSIRTPKPLPETGRIVLELYDELEEYTIPFSLKNISLTGKPLK